MTLAKHVSAARARLCSAGFGALDAAADAEVLARRLLGWDRARFVAESQAEPPAWFGEAYRQWLDRRAGREPVSQITGSREFWGLDFEVSPDVLTPRPETELVVEQALACAAGAGSSQAPPPGRRRRRNRLGVPCDQPRARTARRARHCHGRLAVGAGGGTAQRRPPRCRLARGVRARVAARGDRGSGRSGGGEPAVRDGRRHGGAAG